ncbi:caprin like protein [Ditylenchus destructor]|nr:caprin like protein [Ditylenchus destructor]
MKGPIAATAVDSAQNGKTMKREANAKNGEETFEILSQPTLKVESALEKKLRNLEKRRQKLNQIRADQDSGAKLTLEQSEAISKLDEVVLQIEFIKDLQKLVNQQSRQYQRALRQRDSANEEKNQSNKREVAFSIVRYQEALKVLSSETNKLESAFPAIPSDDLQTVQKFVNSVFASNDVFDSTTDWQNHVNTLSTKLYDITISSGALIDDNLSGLKLKSIIDQMMESPGFQTITAKKFVDGIADGEETETDESSLNDFQPESGGSNQKMMESNQANDTNSPSPMSEISNQAIVSGEVTKVITAEIKGDDTTSGNTQKEDELQNNLVSQNGDNTVNDYVNTAEAISPDPAVQSVDEVVETTKKQESVSTEFAPPADDTKKQDVSTEAVSQPKKNEKPFRRNNYVKKDRTHSNSNQQNGVNDTRQDNRFRRDFQNRGPRKFNNYNNGEKGDASRANPPTVANGEAPIANNGNSRPYKRYSHGEQDNTSGRNAGGFHRRSMEPNNGAYPRRNHADHQTANQQQARPQNGSSNSGGFPDYEKRPPRIRQPYECGFRFAC